MYSLSCTTTSVHNLYIGKRHNYSYNVIINKTKVLLLQAKVTLAEFVYPI
jgi:hypothetical protein